MTVRGEGDLGGGLLGWVLRLYPKRYRDLLGSEMAGTFEVATADAGRGEVLREAFDLAGHGLRVRLGLTSDRYAGAVLAAAVPYVLGCVAGLSGYMLYQFFGAGMNSHHEYLRILPRNSPYSQNTVVDFAPLLVIAAAVVLFLSALAGRRCWTRWSAVATVVAAAITIVVVFEFRLGAHIYTLTTFPGFEMPVMLACFAVLLLAVPTAATSFIERRVPTVVASLTVVGLLHLGWAREGFAWSLITLAPGVVTVILVLALLVAIARRDALIPGAVALACAPWLIQPLTGDIYDDGYSGIQYVVLVWFGIVLILAAGGAQHRRLSRSTNQ